MQSYSRITRGQVCSRTATRACRASFPSCANRGFAGTTVAGHFAQTGPLLWRLVRAGPVPVHFAPAGPLLVDVARTGSLRAHFALAGRVGVFSCAGPVVGHLAQPVLGHLERTAVPVNPAPLSKLGIACTKHRHRLTAVRSDSDRQVHEGRQFRCAPARPSRSVIRKSAAEVRSCRLTPAMTRG